jgi:hypothetical protein
VGLCMAACWSGGVKCFEERRNLDPSGARRVVSCRPARWAARQPEAMFLACFLRLADNSLIPFVAVPWIFTSGFSVLLIHNFFHVVRGLFFSLRVLISQTRDESIKIFTHV